MTIDLSPLYRNTVGFDRFDSLLNDLYQSISKNKKSTDVYPPYDIELIDTNNYRITFLVPGFDKSEVSIGVENEVLSVVGTKTENSSKRNFLHQGIASIASRSFENKFKLESHVEVIDAVLKNGLLTINLVREDGQTVESKTVEISD